MTKKNTIKLTESELKKVITESVKKVLVEKKLQYTYHREKGYNEDELRTVMYYNTILEPLYFKSLAQMSENWYNSLDEKLRNFLNEYGEDLIPDFGNVFVNNLKRLIEN